jgi:hypothetical protein
MIPVVVVSRAELAASRVFEVGQRWALSESSALEVGQNKDPLPKVGGADSGRTEHAPLRIEPQRGQVSDHRSESGRKEPWDVLQEHVARSHLANHASDVGP